MRFVPVVPKRDIKDVAQRIEETEVELKHPEIEFDPSSVIVCLFD